MAGSVVRKFIPRAPGRIPRREEFRAGAGGSAFPGTGALGEVWEELQGYQEHGKVCSAMRDVWARSEDLNWTSLSQEQPDLNFSYEGQDKQDLRAKVEK